MYFYFSCSANSSFLSISIYLENKMPRCRCEGSALARETAHEITATPVCMYILCIHIYTYLAPIYI